MLEQQKGLKKKTLLRILLFLAAAAIITYFIPDRDRGSFNYSIGKPWNYSLLTAPFDMPVMLDSATMKARKDSIDRVFVPYFKVDKTAEKTMLSQLSATGNAEAERIKVHLQRLFERGIVDNDVYAAIKSNRLPMVCLLHDKVGQNISTAQMVSVRKAYEYIDSALSYSSALQGVKLSEIIVPNMVKDTLTTNKLLEDEYRNAISPSGIIQQGERIVDRGEIVTPQTAMLLQTYESMMKTRNKDAKDVHYPIVGYALVVVALLFLLYVFISMFRPRILQSNRKILFVLAMITVFTVFSFMLMGRFHGGMYMLPIALVPIVIVTFFDSRTAFFVSIIQIMLCSLVTEYHLEFILLHLIASIVAIDTLQELSKRSQLVRTAVCVFIAYSVTYVAFSILSNGNINSVGPRIFVYFAINTIMLSFAYVIIFVFERLFGFVSKVTLVELSDVNNPLLRELSEKCPGTFQHSLQLSNLVSEAAHEIGANTQLARAGALYHDIGKMENPAFFTENQHDVNPHELISPEQSAKIVIRHVTDGIKRAEKAKLPDVIKNFILEHHGKSLTKYFYTTACNANGGEPVDPAPYTYPGPNPQSKETAILMMADATEAASRSLKEYNDETISNLVNKIIDGQIAQGLMKDSPLSFRDVETVKKVFISRLRTMYHTRVSYPELIKKENKDGETPQNGK